MVERGNADSVSSDVTNCGWVNSDGGDEGAGDRGGAGAGAGTERAAAVVSRTGSGGSGDTEQDGAVVGFDKTRERHNCAPGESALRQQRWNP